MAHGIWRTRNNADVVATPATPPSQKSNPIRDLDNLASYLIKRHEQAIQQAEMTGRAIAGALPFRWQTEFAYPHWNGWQQNQPDKAHEKNILVVIPGKNRREAVVLADHYDTAYMEDVFDPTRGGTGARQAADGADDNYSATAVLLQAAPHFLAMAREGQLECDIWLLHLTGEEFPADCLGARQFCREMVEGTLAIHPQMGSPQTGSPTPGQPMFGRPVSLAGTRLRGAIVMDMIAHNRERDRDVFQISPGESAESMLVAKTALEAVQDWNTRARL